MDVIAITTSQAQARRQVVRHRRTKSKANRTNRLKNRVNRAKTVRRVPIVAATVASVPLKHAQSEAIPPQAKRVKLEALHAPLIVRPNLTQKPSRTAIHPAHKHATQPEQADLRQKLQQSPWPKRHKPYCATAKCATACVSSAMGVWFSPNVARAIAPSAPKIRICS